MTQPQIPPAGITGKLHETAKDALTWNDERPSTPDDIKKYRQSTVHEPGKIVRHPGHADDPVPQGPFGVKSAASGGQNINEALKNYPDSELARWKLEQAEGVYARCVQRGPGVRARVHGRLLRTGGTWTKCRRMFVTCSVWRYGYALAYDSSSPCPHVCAVPSASRWGRATCAATGCPRGWAASAPSASPTTHG